MSEIEINSLPLIQTKLHRPPLPVEPVQQVNERWERPLTLVSAPTGYGKSTLISEWTQTLDCPSAWVSWTNTIKPGRNAGHVERYRTAPHGILLVRWSMNSMRSGKHMYWYRKITTGMHSWDIEGG